MKSITKKTFFYISGVGSVLSVCLLLNSNLIKNALCEDSLYCYKSFSLLFFFSILSFSFFVFSFIFLFIKNKQKFENWKRFSLYYYIVYIVIVSIFPWYIGDGFMHFQKSQVAIVLVSIHILWSFVLLIRKTK